MMNEPVSLIKPFSTTGERTEKLRFLILKLFVFSLPFDIFYSSILFITLIATTLVDLRKEKFKNIPRQIWIFQIIYLLGIVGYFYSNHKADAGFLLERQLAIFLFPILLPIAFQIDAVKANALLATLAYSCLAAILFLFLNMFHTIHYLLKMPLLQTMFSGVFFNHQFSKPLGIHAGYFSLYVAISIFYFGQLFTQTKQLRVKLILVLCEGILFITLFFLASRNTIIATFIILVIVFPLFNSINKMRYVIISIVCLAVGFLVVKNVPYLSDRFFVQLLSDIKLSSGEVNITYGSAEPRVDRWMGAVSLIKRSPLIGYGTGDEIEMLRTEYIKRGLYISYAEKFNAHNQYLSYLIKNGIIGFGLFLFAFYYYLKLAIRSRNFMYTSFLIMLLIGFYTENILDANKGIVFFALFNTFFGYAALNAQKQGTEKSTNLEIA